MVEPPRTVACHPMVARRATEERLPPAACRARAVLRERRAEVAEAQRVEREWAAPRRAAVERQPAWAAAPAAQVVAPRAPVAALEMPSLRARAVARRRRS